MERTKTVLEEIEQEQLERMHRVYQATKPLMEPAAREAFLEQMPQLSIAISLKRIADFVCGAGDEAPTLDIVQYLGREMRDALNH